MPGLMDGLMCDCAACEGGEPLWSLELHVINSALLASPCISECIFMDPSSVHLQLLRVWRHDRYGRSDLHLPCVLSSNRASEPWGLFLFVSACAGAATRGMTCTKVGPSAILQCPVPVFMLPLVIIPISSVFPERLTRLVGHIGPRADWTASRC